MAAAQRADPVRSEVLPYLDLAQADRSPSWLQRPFPADEKADPNQRGLDTISLLELASLCFVEEAGVLRRYRVSVQSTGSVRIRKAADDRGTICLPRVLRLQVLSLFHERTTHFDSGRLLEALTGEYWWPTMASDAIRFVGQCHICS